MAANTAVAASVQVLSYLAYVRRSGVTAVDVAGTLKTNPVVARRLLKTLERHGLVSVKRGRHGGVALARPPERITLADIRRAVDEGGELFALRTHGNPRCPVNNAMRKALAPVFARASAAVDRSLEATTLAAVLKQV